MHAVRSYIFAKAYDTLLRGLSAIAELLVFQCSAETYIHSESKNCATIH